jgi:twinkle protein
MYYDRLSDLDIKLTRHAGNEKTKCPKCHDGRKNKSDRSLSVNITTGDWNCHNCGWKGNCRTMERKREQKVYERPAADILKHAEMRNQTEAWFKKRGISKPTLDKFMIFNREEWMPQTQKKEVCICFPYFRDGALVNIKFRSNG